MSEHIIKTPGLNDEIDIRCPNCNSNNITIVENSQGYYEIIGCHNCGYKKTPEII